MFGMADTLLGQVLDGRYRLLEVLSDSGPRGVVYRAAHLRLDRTFVVVLNERRGAWVPAVGRGSALAVARHPRESLPSTAEVMGRLGCP